MEIKKRITNYISTIINEIDDDIDLDIDDGKIIGFQDNPGGIEFIIDRNNNQSKYRYSIYRLMDCNITTLYKIVYYIKTKIEYDKEVQEIKQKKNHWDKTKKEWAHKPINRKLILDRIKNDGRRHVKYIAKRSNRTI